VGVIAKHTPGPWQIRRSSGRPYQIEAPAAVGNKNVTNWGGISRRTSPEGEANARLIAAAPELLSMLEAALGALEGAAKEVDACSYMDDDFYEDNICTRIRAAITKAVG